MAGGGARTRGPARADADEPRRGDSRATPAGDGRASTCAAAGQLGRGWRSADLEQPRGGGCGLPGTHSGAAGPHDTGVGARTAGLTRTARASVERLGVSGLPRLGRDYPRQRASGTLPNSHVRSRGETEEPHMRNLAPHLAHLLVAQRSRDARACARAAPAPHRRPRCQGRRESPPRWCRSRSCHRQ